LPIRSRSNRRLLLKILVTVIFEKCKNDNFLVTYVQEALPSIVEPLNSRIHMFSRLGLGGEVENLSQNSQEKGVAVPSDAIQIQYQELERTPVRLAYHTLTIGSPAGREVGIMLCVVRDVELYQLPEATVFRLQTLCAVWAHNSWTSSISYCMYQPLADVRHLDLFSKGILQNFESACPDKGEVSSHLETWGKNRSITWPFASPNLSPTNSPTFPPFIPSSTTASCSMQHSTCSSFLCSVMHYVF